MKTSNTKDQSGINNTGKKIDKNNNKKFISKALEKYLDKKIIIEDENLFKDNVEKIQNIVNTTNDFKNFKFLSSIPNTTKNSNRKMQKNIINSINNEISQINFSKNNGKLDNDSEIIISDYDDLKRNLQTNNSNIIKKQTHTQKNIIDSGKFFFILDSTNACFPQYISPFSENQKIELRKKIFNKQKNNNLSIDYSDDFNNDIIYEGVNTDINVNNDLIKNFESAKELINIKKSIDKIENNFNSKKSSNSIYSYFNKNINFKNKFMSKNSQNFSSDKTKKPKIELNITETNYINNNICKNFKKKNNNIKKNIYNEEEASSIQGYQTTKSNTNSITNSNVFSMNNLNSKNKIDNNNNINFKKNKSIVIPKNIFINSKIKINKNGNIIKYLTYINPLEINKTQIDISLKQKQSNKIPNYKSSINSYVSKEKINKKCQKLSKEKNKKFSEIYHENEIILNTQNTQLEDLLIINQKENKNNFNNISKELSITKTISTEKKKISKIKDFDTIESNKDNKKNNEDIDDENNTPRLNTEINNYDKDDFDQIKYFTNSIIEKNNNASSKTLIPKSTKIFYNKIPNFSKYKNSNLINNKKTNNTLSNIKVSTNINNKSFSTISASKNLKPTYKNKLNTNELTNKDNKIYDSTNSKNLNKSCLISKKSISPNFKSENNSKIKYQTITTTESNKINNGNSNSKLIKNKSPLINKNLITNKNINFIKPQKKFSRNNTNKDISVSKYNNNSQKETSKNLLNKSIPLNNYKKEKCFIKKNIYSYKEKFQQKNNENFKRNNISLGKIINNNKISNLNLENKNKNKKSTSVDYKIVQSRYKNDYFDINMTFIEKCKLNIDEIKDLIYFPIKLEKNLLTINNDDNHLIKDKVFVPKLNFKIVI